MSEWEVVYTASSEAEAQIVIGRLATENIHAMMQFEPAGQAIGITIGTLGAVRVLVSPVDAERAVEILEDDASLALLDDEDAE